MTSNDNVWKVRNTTRNEEMRYPLRWGGRVRKNPSAFRSVCKGDMIYRYFTNGKLRGIVSILKCVKSFDDSDDGGAFWTKKVRNLPTMVPWEEIRADPTLMNSYVVKMNASGSLFSLSDAEAKALERLVAKADRLTEGDIDSESRVSVHNGHIGSQRASKQSVDIENFEKEIQATDTVRETKCRGGQAQYRTKLMRRWMCRCAITGITEYQLLRASHMKRFSDCRENERYDVDNGLILAAHVDALFDSGLITFTDAGVMRFSKKLSLASKNSLHLPGRLAMRLNSKQKKYLKWHREHVFKK